VNDPFSEFGLRRVINAVGPATGLGASPVRAEVMAAIAGIVDTNVEMMALQASASQAIAEATGAEAGFVTACAASGISVTCAACMTGEDLDAIERLPDTRDLARTEVVLQKGQAVDYSGNLTQMIRLSGAQPIEIGAVNSASLYQLEGAIGECTAAAIYVVSEQASLMGMLSLEDFSACAKAAGIPVLVDAAPEWDLRKFLAAGADLVIYSAHKQLGSLTGGIVAGRKDLVRAAYMQERGIARAMKVGKEGVAGVIAALRIYHGFDPQRERARLDGLNRIALDRLTKVPGLTAFPAADATNRGFDTVRIVVDADRTGMTASELARALEAGDPTIKIQDYYLDRGEFDLNPACLTEENMAQICDRIEAALAQGPANVPPARPGSPYLDSWHAAFTTWPDGT
jgi:L-seryl-tRNA(Ser) seleniumtransferase